MAPQVTISDISKYQSRRINPDTGNWDAANWDTTIIDWERFLESEGSPEAVIVRVGDGTNLDPCFFRYMEQITLRSIPWGIYHLFRPSADEAYVRSQARRVREWVAGVPPLGVWGDLEVTGGQPKSVIVRSFQLYLGELDRLFGIVTGVYSGAWFLDPNFTVTEQMALNHRAGWWSGYPGLVIPAGWKVSDRPYTLHQNTDEHPWPGLKNPADASYLRPGLELRELRNPPLDVLMPNVPPPPAEGTVPPMPRGLSKLVPNHQIGGGSVSAPWLQMSVGAALVSDLGLSVEAPEGSLLMGRVDDGGFPQFFGQKFDANRLAFQMPPTVAAEKWYNAFLPQIKANPRIRFWSTPIEQIITTADTMAWYGAFCYEYARLIKSNHPGRSAALGGWATGTPEFKLWANWTMALLACRHFDAVISLHRYGPPYILDAEKRSTGVPDLFNGLRYRQDYDHFCRLGFADVRIVLEECGADDAGGEHAWKNFFPNFAAYWDEHLHPLALALEEDPYVLFGAVFTCMGGGGWDNFNLVGTDIVDRIRSFVAEPARELLKMYTLVLDTEGLDLQDAIRKHLSDMAQDVNQNSKVAPYGSAVSAPLPNGVLYLAEVRYGLTVRDAAGVQIMKSNGQGLTYEAGEIVTVYAEKQTAGTYLNRVKITRSGINVWDGTGDARGPALRRL